MALQTTGEISVGVPQDAAFGFVRDAQRLAACIPGCSDLRELGAERYSAVLTSRVAFITVSFKVVIEVVRVDPPHAIEATMTGDALGLAGHVAATAAVALSADGEQQTTIRYTTDIALTGRLGGLGQPVFRATSAQLAREFGANLKRALEPQPTIVRS
jgi:carbon monoxide dehydrogenase subunit G